MNKIARMVTKLEELDARSVPAETADEFDEPPYIKQVSLGSNVAIHIEAKITTVTEVVDEAPVQIRKWDYQLAFRGQLRIVIRGDLAKVKAELTNLADQMSTFSAALTAALA